MRRTRSTASSGAVSNSCCPGLQAKAGFDGEFGIFVEKDLRGQSWLCEIFRPWHGNDVVAGIDVVDFARHTAWTRREQIEACSTHFIHGDGAAQRCVGIVDS